MLSLITTFGSTLCNSLAKEWREAVALTRETWKSSDEKLLRRTQEQRDSYGHQPEQNSLTEDRRIRAVALRAGTTLVYTTDTRLRATVATVPATISVVNFRSECITPTITNPRGRVWRRVAHGTFCTDKTKQIVRQADDKAVVCPKSTVNDGGESIVKV